MIRMASRAHARTGLTAAALVLLAGTAAAAATVTANASASSPARPAVGPVPTGFEPESVTFVSASDGWVLGTAPCAHQPCTSVVRTTNGGRSWVGIPAPRFRLSRYRGGPGLDGMRFADTQDGFAFGSQLWVTHDGGATAAGWRRVRLPGYVADLETAAGVVYAAVSNSHQQVTVYRSQATGGAWHKVSGLPAKVGGGAGLGTITLHGSAAWIILGNRLYASQHGARWTTEPFTCPRKVRGITSVGATSSTRITLLCTGDAALGSELKVLYASADGGAHFRRAGRPPMGGTGLNLLAQPAARHVFIATFSGATWLDVSKDGGRVWHTSLGLSDGGKGWADFGFTTATQGVAIEGMPSIGSRMYVTRNAGRSWHKVKF
jgi:hypothetical protein